MAAILYVRCNLKPVGQSRSLSVGAEFLETYVSRNPHDRVHVIDVYRDPIQRIDAAYWCNGLCWATSLFTIYRRSWSLHEAH